MLLSIIKKDIQNILFSPKFTSTFLVSSILILLSIFIGIREYQSSVEQYNAGTLLANQDLSERTSWMGVSTKTYREPDPMQIFVSGVNNDIGRLSVISQYDEIHLKNSSYSDEPVYAVFRSIDFVFIVQIVLTLLAIMFTYDAINGERESGMLKLIFSNTVPRFKYLMAKVIGSWLGLIIPLLVPILLGILLIFLFNIPMQSQHWIKLIILLVLSLIYFTFFIVFSLLISTATQRSASSFLILLVFWVAFVLVIPRAGTMLAGQFIQVPGAAEIESQKEGYAKELWNKHDKALQERWQVRNAEMEGMTSDERESYQDEHMWEWMEKDEAIRNDLQKEILNYSKKITEDLRNRKIRQEKLGFILSRFSPASSFQLAAMNLAEMDIDLKNRYTDAMDNYRNSFTQFIEKKQKENPGSGGIQITLDSERGLNINTPDMTNTIDVSEMPRFFQPKRTLAFIINPTLPDFGLLICLTLISFIFSVFLFTRYDVR